MIDKQIIFKYQTSLTEDIYLHLKGCDKQFSPPLSPRINILEYAEKIYNKADRFEAWLDKKLAGLVASYHDKETATGFVTNVSVDEHLARQGISQKLLENCIKRYQLCQCNAISLEVNHANIKAINLYKKLGFLEYKNSNNNLYMRVSLGENSGYKKRL